MKPMLATRGDHVPAGSGWTHEVKWDGMRVLVGHEAGRLRVWSRNENDVSVSFPELQPMAEVLPEGTLLDGEVVALADGAPSFGALADRMHVRDARRAAQLATTNPVTLLAFDLLRVAGEELLGRPLAERRERLLGLGLDPSTGSGSQRWQVPPAYDDGAMLLAAAEQQGLEGIVSKRLAAAYHPGRRSRDWLKFPIRPTASYVVGGLRWETGSSHRIGALLVGEPGPEGLRYRGRVGSGIAGKAGVTLAELLAPRHADASPFADEVPRVDRLGTVWVEPGVVVDVQYLRLTTEGRLRQPAYRGVRHDLDPGDL